MDRLGPHYCLPVKKRHIENKSRTQIIVKHLKVCLVMNIVEIFLSYNYAGYLHTLRGYKNLFVKILLSSKFCTIYYLWSKCPENTSRTLLIYQACIFMSSCGTKIWFFYWNISTLSFVVDSCTFLKPARIFFTVFSLCT